jgi:SAM-dependent methyltransferase
VLEIGVGMGGDFVRFGRAGASAVGLDLSIRSLALARQNAEINHVLPTLLNADALAISLRLCVALPELSEKLTRV